MRTSMSREGRGKWKKNLLSFHLMISIFHFPREGVVYFPPCMLCTRKLLERAFFRKLYDRKTTFNTHSLSPFHSLARNVTPKLDSACYCNFSISLIYYYFYSLNSNFILSLLTFHHHTRFVLRHSVVVILSAATQSDRRERESACVGTTRERVSEIAREE